MATTFRFFHDAGLTQEISAANPLSATQLDDGSLAPTDVQVWFGSPVVSTKIQATSDPGIDAIAIIITDLSVGAGEAASAISLAMSQLGLDAAVPGDSIDVGNTVYSGPVNAIQFWARIDPTQTVIGEYTDLGLDFTDCTESAA